jgi:hypothetical protein
MGVGGDGKPFFEKPISITNSKSYHKILELVACSFFCKPDHSLIRKPFPVNLATNYLRQTILKLV